MGRYSVHITYLPLNKKTKSITYALEDKTIFIKEKQFQKLKKLVKNKQYDELVKEVKKLFKKNNIKIYFICLYVREVFYLYYDDDENFKEIITR